VREIQFLILESREDAEHCLGTNAAKIIVADHNSLFVSMAMANTGKIERSAGVFGVHGPESLEICVGCHVVFFLWVKSSPIVTTHWGRVMEDVVTVSNHRPLIDSFEREQFGVWMNMFLEVNERQKNTAVKRCEILTSPAVCDKEITFC
jgi:hypothetical protein